VFAPAHVLVLVLAPAMQGDVAHLDGHDFEGGARLRLRLPADADQRAGGVPFSVAVVGRERRGPRSIQRARRWAGGLPPDTDAGAVGRLFPRREA